MRALLVFRSIIIAKISEKNARYRSKEEICHDLSNILNSDLTYGTKFAVAFEIIWVWSEYNGKHKGCKFWSEKALKSGLDNKYLIHEHLVPRKILMNKLFNEVIPNQRSIFDFLDSYCVGVVVTKDEDNRLNQAGLRSVMPGDWDNKDPWARYKKVAIKIVDTELTS